PAGAPPRTRRPADPADLQLHQRHQLPAAALAPPLRPAAEGRRARRTSARPRSPALRPPLPRARGRGARPDGLPGGSGQGPGRYAQDRDRLDEGAAAGELHGGEGDLLAVEGERPALWG